MKANGFENLTLNGALLEAFYGDIDFLLNIDSQIVKQKIVTPEVTKSVEVKIEPTIINSESLLDLNGSAIFLIILNNGEPQKELFADILNKMLVALNKTANDAKVLVWDNGLDDLINEFKNCKEKKVIWVAGMQPNEENNSLNQIMPFKVLKQNSILYICTLLGQELTDKENKMALWSFFKQNI